MRLLVCLILAIIMPSLTYAAEAEWELKKENDELGLKVYTRSIEGSKLKEFKGEMTVEATLDSITALLLDGHSAPKWMHKCEKLEVLEERSKQEFIIYFVNGAPWPVSDRDAVVHTTMTQDPDSLVVTRRSRPCQKDWLTTMITFVFPAMTGGWELIPVGENKVMIRYQVHAAPGGSLPAWFSELRGGRYALPHHEKHACHAEKRAVCHSRCGLHRKHAFDFVK